jgi:hypothetical protein
MAGMAGMSPRQIADKLRMEKWVLDRRIDLTRRCIGLLSDITEMVKTSEVHDTEVMLAILIKMSAVQLLQLDLSLKEGEEQSAKMDEYLERSESLIATPSMVPPQATTGMRKG